MDQVLDMGHFMGMARVQAMGRLEVISVLTQRHNLCNINIQKMCKPIPFPQVLIPSAWAQPIHFRPVMLVLQTITISLVMVLTKTNIPVLHTTVMEHLKMITTLPHPIRESNTHMNQEFQTQVDWLTLISSPILKMISTKIILENQTLEKTFKFSWGNQGKMTSI